MDGDRLQRPPRVLVEALEWAVAEATADAFGSAGWEVTTCGGPVGLEHRCPFLDGGTCSKVEWADVVVSRLSLHDVRNRELLQLLARDKPVVAETPTRTYERYRRELQACTPIAYPARLGELVAAAAEHLAAAAPGQTGGVRP